ncbi:MAG: helix-turn-helix domain-containing protein [Chloroflexi bacterium]|nr:helix-turn-helix domain-containing protein [Chloroflexota bacterium]MCI0788613.1 helix-turn-helix domain-containing protein [Chloroflexota bacterium]MCI0897999.1 helix-turn-helix domain-containing protein [Chloroflexota bacterium]
MPRTNSSLQNNLKRARARVGLTQGELAGQAGISRQAYSSLESGSANPSTEVALRLARALGERVESLFYLPEQPPAAVDAELLAGSSPGRPLGGPAQRARLFRVGQKLLARPLNGAENTRHAVVAAEGLVLSQGREGRVTVQPFDPEEIDSPTLAMLGCDPAVGLLETGLRSRGVALVAGEESSHQALVGLARGEAHVAGCHLLDDATGTYNDAWVRQLVPFPCVLVTFASWQQGLILAYGNPKQLGGVSDLANPGIRLVNRQAGSGSRALLDRALAGAGIPTEAVLGYEREEWGHLAVAAAVASGNADVGIGVKAAAVAMGLDFLPLEEERYDLVIPEHFLSHGPVQVLLDLLRRPVLHRQVESLGGYDASNMGVQASTV